MTIRIRRITDRAEALRALTAAAGTARSDEETSAILARTDVHVLAAYDGDQPVGSLIAHELPRLLRAGTGMLLYTIDVAEPHRRRGIGKALIADLRRVARERGCDAIWLLTNASNEAAMRLYEAAGGRRPNADDVMWEWPLARE